MRLAYANGGLWAVGNGLATTTLVVYLARELGAEQIGAAGLTVSFILAAPRLVGLLRIAAAAVIERFGDRKRFSLVCYFASNLVLLALPLVCAPGVLPTTTQSLTALVSLWTAYHLLEYFATVSLWSWLGDIAPLRIRGRFIGRRERWMMLGILLGMTTSGLFAYYWREQLPGRPVWVGYAIPAGLGALMMMVSLVPLARMPSIPLSVGRRLAAPLTTLAAPFRDRRFLRLLLFGCWFSFFNGATQAAQGILPIWVLQFHLFWMLAFQAGMRLGQSGISPTIGSLADRFGNRPIMIVAQVLVACGPLFYLAATTGSRWWLAGAWILWIAYAGLNVTLPNLMLKLAPGGSSASYIAAYFGVTGLFYGLSTIIGGAVFDVLAARTFMLTLGAVTLDHFQFLFVIGWVARLAGVVFLCLLIEPGAWRLRDVVKQLWPRRAGRRPVGETVS